MTECIWVKYTSVRLAPPTGQRVNKYSLYAFKYSLRFRKNNHSTKKIDCSRGMQ